MNSHKYIQRYNTADRGEKQGENSKPKTQTAH